MTLGAKVSRLRATSGDQMLAGVARSVVDAAAAAGMDRDALLARIGLRPEELEQPDGLVPVEAYIAAWEAIAADPAHDDFGLRLGAMASPRFLGGLGYALLHAETALGAVSLFRRFRQLVSDTLAPEIDVDGEHVIYHQALPPRISRIVQFADCAFAGTVTLLRDVAGLPRSAPLAVEAWYQCPRPQGVDRGAELGCPVRFGAPEMRIVLSRALLDRPLPRHDPALFDYLERHVQAVLARVPPQPCVAERVRRLITDGLRAGEPSQAELGRKLGLSERTLQRRLREEGTSFAAILEEVRRELSELYLSEPTLSLHEIAFLLGYSEPSAFHRAFRRWTGATPQAYRRSAKHDAGSHPRAP